jgi:hypothetical protein
MIFNLTERRPLIMAINKATLAKEIDGVIEYIYPKTSADIVVYDETHSVAAMIENLVNGKQSVEEGKGLSTNDFTDNLKTKLDGIDVGATKVIVDSALSKTSENAIQNKAVSSVLGAVSADELSRIYGATSVLDALINLKNRIESFNLDVDENGRIVSTIG